MSNDSNKTACFLFYHQQNVNGFHMYVLLQFFAETSGLRAYAFTHVIDYACANGTGNRADSLIATYTTCYCSEQDDDAFYSLHILYIVRVMLQCTPQDRSRGRVSCTSDKTYRACMHIMSGYRSRSVMICMHAL